MHIYIYEFFQERVIWRVSSRDFFVDLLWIFRERYKKRERENLYLLSDFFRVKFFPKALRRVLPENPLNADTSTLTLTH